MDILTNIELLEISIKRDCFSGFINGSIDEFKIYSEYLNLPTNPEKVFDTIKIKANMDGNYEIWSMFENELISMQNTSIGLWFSLYYVFSIIIFQKKT